MAELLGYVTERTKMIVGKNRNCWLPAFSQLAKMFSKAFLFIVVKTLVQI